MIAMLDTSEKLATCEAEIGCKVEQLLTPLTQFTCQQEDEHFAIDNGCFKRFDEGIFPGPPGEGEEEALAVPVRVLP